MFRIRKSPAGSNLPARRWRFRLFPPPAIDATLTDRFDRYVEAYERELAASDLPTAELEARQDAAREILLRRRRLA